MADLNKEVDPILGNAAQENTTKPYQHTKTQVTQNGGVLSAPSIDMPKGPNARQQTILGNQTGTAGQAWQPPGGQQSGGLPPSPPAYTTQIDQGETVEGRMTRMLGEDSMYRKQFETEALKKANSMGMLNSSMAIQSGLAAAQQAALPIAQQDQAAYMDNLSRNQQYINQERDAQRSTMFQNWLSTKDQGRQKEIMDLDFNLNEAAANSAKVRQVQVMNEEARIREKLAGVDQKYAVELETLKNNFNLTQNMQTQSGSVYSDSIKSISAILSNHELTPQQQQAAVKVETDMLANALTFLNSYDTASSPGVVKVNPR